MYFSFFSFNGKPGHRGPTHPILMENSINFFFFFTLNLPCRFKVTSLTFISSSPPSDTFTFVGYKYKVSVIQAILWKMLSKVFISFRFGLPNGQEDHDGESRGQLITSLL